MLFSGMEQKAEKPWVWDLDVEQKLTKKFCTNFARKDPLFAQWADCLHSICVMESKIHDYSRTEKPHGFSQPSQDEKPTKEQTVRSTFEPQDTYDPVVYQVGRLLASDPKREADRLRYLMIIFNEAQNIDHEAAGYALNSVLGVGLQSAKSRHRPQ